MDLANQPIHLFLVECLNLYLGELTHTLVPCWTPKPLPLRNQCTSWFAPAPKPLPPRNKCTGCFALAVRDEHVEFEKLPVGVNDIKKITDHCRGLNGLYFQQEITTCNWLDLETLGFGLIVATKSPHTLGGHLIWVLYLGSMWLVFEDLWHSSDYIASFAFILTQ